MTTRFTPAFIQQLKGEISLVDIVRENVELKKSGHRFMGRCPFHGDRTPSFSVNKDFYYCFGCKETGDLISFVMKLHSLSFEEAIEDLAEKAKLTVPESTMTSEQERAQYLRRVKNQKAARLNHFASLQFYHQNLLKHTSSPLFQEAREYLRKRGVSAKTIEDFQVGVAGGESNGLAQFLEHAKAPLDLAREYGLIRPSQKHAGDYDFFRERIVFPLIDPRGRVCGYGGRILPSVDARTATTDVKLPKYLNSAESELFQKSKFLYGLYQAKLAIREEEVAIVVEGYFDVMGLFQSGIQNVVAPCGTSLTEDHLRQLSKIAKKIIVFFDRDQAGISATQKSMELALKMGILVYGIRYESTLDPDEFLLESPDNLKKLKQWILNAEPILDMEIDRLMKESDGKIEERSLAIKQASTWLTQFTDQVGRSVRVQELVKRYGVPESALGALRPAGGSMSSQSRVQRSAPPPGSAPQRRLKISPYDRQLLQFLVKFGDFGNKFLEAKKRLPEKDTLCCLFDDQEIRDFVERLSSDPAGFSRLKHAPEWVLEKPLSQELQSVIMEGLLQERVSGEDAQLESLLSRGIYNAWARFSHKIQKDLSAAEKLQDMETVKELSELFLDVRKKLIEFKDSYVTGKTD